MVSYYMGCGMWNSLLCFVEPNFWLSIVEIVRVSFKIQKKHISLMYATG